MPRDRIWNNEIAQKCERCGSKNLSCGPNLLRENDPVFTRRAENCHEGQSSNTMGSPYDTNSTASPTAGSLTTVHDYPSPFHSIHSPDDDNTGTTSILYSEEKEGNNGADAYFAEKLKVEALAKYILPSHCMAVD